MITHFLGREQVTAYAADLARRLIALGTDFPRVWCPLGISGQKMAEVVGDLVGPDLMAGVSVVRLHSDRATGRVVWIDSMDGVDMSCPVLLIDSAIHTGHSMRAAADDIVSRGGHEIITYSLVIKAGSEFIPNFFGVVIGDHDRAYFQLDVIPNNRLQRDRPFGALRALGRSDVSRPFPLTGLASMDHTSFSDLVYEVESRGSHVYVYEHAGQICGYLSFEKRNGTLFIDGVGAAQAYQGRNVGGLLMRWAETWARSHRCDTIELWAIENRVAFYQSRGFVSADRHLDLGDEQYLLMRRRLLYNVKPEVA